MPVIVKEIVIKTNVEKKEPTGAAQDLGFMEVDEIVKQAVEKVMEILEEKNNAEILWA